MHFIFFKFTPAVVCCLLALTALTGAANDDVSSILNKIDKGSINSTHQQEKPRDPRDKDVANVFWKRQFQLYDKQTLEPIFPRLANGVIVYDIYYSSNEQKFPRQGSFTEDQLEKLLWYKFKTLKSCESFCYGDKAPGGVVKTNSQQIQSADAELNQVYQELKGRLGPAEKENLKTAQRAWIKQRDALVANNKDNPQAALYQATQARVAELRQWIDRTASQSQPNVHTPSSPAASQPDIRTVIQRSPDAGTVEKCAVNKNVTLFCAVENNAISIWELPSGRFIKSIKRPFSEACTSLSFYENDILRMRGNKVYSIDIKSENVSRLLDEKTNRSPNTYNHTFNEGILDAKLSDGTRVNIQISQEDYYY
jgi:uncharacterized protein YecT (DUF1311 family)